MPKLLCQLPTALEDGRFSKKKGQELATDLRQARSKLALRKRGKLKYIREESHPLRIYSTCQCRELSYSDLGRHFAWHMSTVFF